MEQYTIIITEYTTDGIKNRAFTGLLNTDVGDSIMSLNGSFISLGSSTAEEYDLVSDAIASGDLVPTEHVDVFPGANLAIIGSDKILLED